MEGLSGITRSSNQSPGAAGATGATGRSDGPPGPGAVGPGLGGFVRLSGGTGIVPVPGVTTDGGTEESLLLGPEST